MNRFNEFQLSSEILRGIQDLGFEEPSPIQQECIPMVLDGQDIIG